MQLSPQDLASLSQTAVAAALQAGQVIAQYAGGSFGIRHKQGGDNPASQVVTEVDLRSEAVILDALRPSCQHYDLALLTEETTDDRKRLDKDYFWCIDPLDGTQSFIESTPGYAVSIALVARSGQPVIGVVHDPVGKLLYCAVNGQGVSRNGQAVSVNKAGYDSSLTIICDPGLVQRPYFPQLQESLQRSCHSLGLSQLKFISSHGAVMNACRVLEYSPSCYFKCPKPQQGGGSLWDYAATAAILTEYGAIASDFNGQALDLNRADTTFMNDRGVIFATDALLATAVQQLQSICAGHTNNF